MSLNYIAIGQRIKALRGKHGLSQAALSELIDKSPTYISYIENGVKSMSLETFVSIANALGCPADELLGDNIKYDRRTMARSKHTRNMRLYGTKTIPILLLGMS